MNTHKEEHQHKLPYMPRELEFNTGKAVTFKFICRECGEEAVYTQPPVEPTPPSQIEEESQTQRSLREMYELGKEHGRTLALKDMEIEKLLKEIKGE